MGHDVTWQAEAVRIQSQGVVAMSAFSEGISSIYAATEQVGDLCRTLLDINSGDSALEQLDKLGAAIDDLCHFLEAWLAQTNSGDLRLTLLRIKGDLEDVQKLGIRFRVVASLTAINVTSAEGEMDGFIEELRAVPDQIGTAVDALLRRLDAVDLVVQEAIQTAHDGLKTMGKARRILARHSDGSRAVFRQIVDSRAAMEMIGNRYLFQSQEQTKALVRGFQYSDFFAQRLDHAAQILGHEAEFGPCVRLLAARQLSALAEQGRDTVRGIMTALQAQSVSTAQFTVDFSDQGKLGADGNLELQAIFAAIMASRSRALPVIVASVTSSRHVLEEIGLCHDSFAKLVDMSGVMDLAAINARLGASRQNKSKVEMSFLSDAVIDGARSCRDALDRSSDGLARVAAVQDKDMLDQLVTCVAHFTDAFDQCQKGLAESEQRIGRLSETLVAMSRLIGTSKSLLAHCQATAENLTAIVETLDSFSQDLSAGLPVPEIWPDMTTIYDGYTIQDERDAHDLLIGRALSAPGTSAPMELDDVFF